MIRVGKIVATHGLNGAVIATHIVGHGKWVQKDKPVFVEIRKESYIPYFVTEVNSADAAECNLLLEDVDSVDEAKKLIGKSIYVEQSVLDDHITDSPLGWIGYKIEDKKYGKLGVIEDMMQTSAQWLAKICYKDTEVLLPMIEQTIEGIDPKRKTIYTRMPEGLLEVYTEK